MRILVVDDEDDIIDLISFHLEREGYAVTPARSGEEALELLKTTRPDAIVLDLMLPGIQGLEVCKELRASPEYGSVPILMLSAKAGELDRVLGLEIGADDYITKPFSVRELVARIRAAIRRTRGPQVEVGMDRPFLCRDLSIDFNKYEVTVKDRRIELSPTEMKLLFFFAKNPGRVYGREQLLQQVWGDDKFVSPRSVDVHISRLRKLIEPDAQRPTYIVTVTSVGYKFDGAEAISKAS